MWLFKNNNFQVDEKSVKKIYKKFYKLDKINKGYVSYYDLLRLPEINQNPLGLKYLIFLFRKYFLINSWKNCKNTRTFCSESQCGVY